MTKNAATTSATTAESVAHWLLELQAVQFNLQRPFQYASGLKGPIYCDNRLTISSVDVREKLADAFSEIIQLQQRDCQIIAGLATAGIPHAAWVAQRLKIPMIYVRSQAKGHGLANVVEGRAPAGSRVVVLEDLVNQGQSVAGAVENLQKLQIHVLGVYCIVDYEMPQAQQYFQQMGIPLVSLTQFSVLLKVAQEKGLVSQQETQAIWRWHQHPQNWPN